MKRANCLTKLNSLLERHSLLIYSFNNDITSLAMPTTHNQLQKYLSKETVEQLAKILNFEHVYGNIDLMKDKNGRYYIDGVYFGLPLKSLNLTGFVCDGILNNNETHYQAHLTSWKETVEQVQEQYGKMNASHVIMPCKKILLNPN